MRRFDESQRLDHLCERGELSPDHIRSLARRMAAFQTRAAVADPAKRWGHPAAAMRWPRDNFQTLAATLTSATDAALIRQLREWTEERFGTIEPLLARRRQKDRVREGHGDLHLANLVLVDDEVLPFDGIEFNDELRWIDVANDMAFAWMDLLHQEQPGLANLLLSEWLDASGDVSAPGRVGLFCQLPRRRARQDRRDPAAAAGRRRAVARSRYLPAAGEAVPGRWPATSARPPSPTAGHHPRALGLRQNLGLQPLAARPSPAGAPSACAPTWSANACTA